MATSRLLPRLTPHTHDDATRPAFPPTEAFTVVCDALENRAKSHTRDIPRVSAHRRLHRRNHRLADDEHLAGHVDLEGLELDDNGQLRAEALLDEVCETEERGSVDNEKEWKYRAVRLGIGLDSKTMHTRILF